MAERIQASKAARCAVCLHACLAQQTATDLVKLKRKAEVSEHARCIHACFTTRSRRTGSSIGWPLASVSKKR